MRDAVREAIERCERATLVFDARQLASNMQAVAVAASASNITPLFAMKSFPHSRVLELARAALAGFDAASVDELRVALATADSERGRIISIADPSGQAIAHASADRRVRGVLRVIVACESAEQVCAAPAHADIALRVSASITGRDPAVGAILDGTGHRRSRFGVSTASELRALRDAALDSGGAANREGAVTRRVGLHVHHGPVTATSAERFVASAKAAIELARSAGIEPAFIDLGGAWHGIGIANIGDAFAQIRAGIDDVMGADRHRIEILVEPGRLFVEGAGFAVGPTHGVRDLGDGRVLVTTGLSRICHLRWSQVELVARAPHPGAGVKAIVVGPTCYEEDVVGEWIVEPREIAERVVVRNVSGYAVAWNKSFGGVDAADVVFVE
jgi:diaminopimelate decarboxylase